MKGKADLSLTAPGLTILSDWFSLKWFSTSLRLLATVEDRYFDVIPSLKINC